MGLYPLIKPPVRRVVMISVHEKNNRSHDCSIDLNLFKDRLGYPSLAISDLDEDAIAIVLTILNLKLIFDTF